MKTEKASRPRQDPQPRRSLVLALVLLILSLSTAATGQNLQFAELGECKLDSGQVIENCRIEYRTTGTLRGEGENAVLFPTWFSGNTGDLLDFVGTNKHLDPSRYFVVLMGAFGNGLSSSPSNSKTQRAGQFPTYTVRDMVRAQYRFVTEKLGLRKAHAVVGISMGGMQTFEWMVSYPEFMGRAVPIVGSPRLAPYDLLLWRSQLHAIEEALQAYEDPADQRRAAMRVVSDIHQLALTTPQRFNSENDRGAVEKVMAVNESDLIQEYDPQDWASQLRAMISHNIALRFGDSMGKAAAAVKAKLLVISSPQDHMVTPGPSFDFARQVQAQTVVLESACGHLATSCASETVIQAVRRFLAN